MKKLNVVLAALVSSALSLTAVADISISGDGRYRFGVKDTGSNANESDISYRNGRMRFTVEGGNANAGIQMRVRTDFGQVPAGANDSIRADRRNAFVNLGPVKVTMGEQGNYTGLLGTYYGGSGEFTDLSAITISGGNDMVSGFITESHGDAADQIHTATGLEIKNTISRYGLSVNYQGISVDYVARPSNLVKGDAVSEWGVEAFQDILVSGNFGGTSVEFNSSKSDAENADAMLLRVTAPVAGYTIKLGYADLEGGYDNDDWGTMLGEGIHGVGYQTKIVGESANDETYTGLAIAGSAGNVNYQLTAGSVDDDNDATSDGFYDISASYGLDASTTLKFGMGKSGDERGMGFEVSYSF